MRVDLNADVGESLGPWVLGHDPGMMASVTSVSVACGFHAGDPGVMRETVALALQHGVAIGAHPSFPDLTGFGRRQMRLSPREIEDLVVYQVGALSAVAAAQGGRLQHVKPHGALYNMAAGEPPLAAAIARAIASVDPGLMLVGLSGSALIDAGRDAGLRTASEVFADRGYRADGSLLPRDAKGALVHDAGLVSVRAVEMVRHQAVTLDDGQRMRLQPDTICIHGDTTDAPVLARAVRRALEQAGVDVRAMGA
jgi:5-oxoprolinase (ATP-hydrolysing) subunit A